MNKSDLERDYYMLKGPLAKQGYDWWWHSLTAYNKETGEAKPFFIEYFVCNPALAEDKPVLGQDPENKKLGGSCTVTPEDAENHPEFMCDAGDMRWDLDIDKQIAFNVGYGANGLFRKLNSFEMFWHAEGIKTQYSGSIWLDGVEYEVIPEKSYGYADKNWGGDFTSPWLWISSCNLTSLKTGKKLNNSAFEAGGGRPKAFGISIPRKLLIGFYYEGTMYEYNFARFWNMVKIDFDFEEGDDVHTWHVNASNKNSRMELVLYCKRDEMLLINYEAPNGKKLHNRLWNGGNGWGEIKLYKKDGTLIDHVKMENTGCEYGEYDKE